MDKIVAGRILAILALHQRRAGGEKSVKLDGFKRAGQSQLQSPCTHPFSICIHFDCDYPGPLI